jgi:hypothetical protein
VLHTIDVLVAQVLSMHHYDAGAQRPQPRSRPSPKEGSPERPIPRRALPGRRPFAPNCESWRLQRESRTSRVFNEGTRHRERRPVEYDMRSHKIGGSGLAPRRQPILPLRPPLVTESRGGLLLINLTIAIALALSALIGFAL